MLAAATGEPITPVTRERDRWYAEIERLEQLSLAEAFARLAEREPALAAYRGSIAEQATSWWPEDHNEDENCVWWFEILDALERIVGPDSGAASRLGRSSTAFDISKRYLATVAGIQLL